MSNEKIKLMSIYDVKDAVNDQNTLNGTGPIIEPCDNPDYYYDEKKDKSVQSRHCRHKTGSTSLCNHSDGILYGGSAECPMQRGVIVRINKG